METATFNHPTPLRLPRILGERCMLRKEWPGKDNAYEAFMDFGQVERIEYGEKRLDEILTELLASKSTIPDQFSFRCGFLGYEILAGNFGVQCRAPRDLDLPAALLARPTTQLHIEGNQVTVESHLSGRVQEILNLAEQPLPTSQSSSRPSNIQPNLNYKDYERIFKQAREHILDGNTYQIKISIRYTAQGTIDPVTTFEKLATINPSPEAFLLDWDDFALISCSPETVIRKTGNHILTRPIGGTFEKQADASPKQQIKAFLRNSKETAEHNMLIDLERNDLSRICTPGSVAIEKLREVETYAHLHHLVSTISGNLRDGTSVQKIFSAMLPGGTITGCPKHRTIELIDELETCFRGPYTGSFGTFHDNGDLHLNLIIRNIVQTAGKCYVQAGGGIVVDSNAEYEYNENQIKAQALLELLN